MDFKNTVKSEAEERYQNMLDHTVRPPFPEEVEPLPAEAFRQNTNRYHARLEKEQHEFNRAIQKVKDNHNERVREANDFATEKKRKAFKRAKVLKTIALLIPLLLCAVVGYDIFNIPFGHMYDIPLALGWIIALYVIFCIGSIVFSVLTIKNMNENDTFKEPVKTYKRISIVLTVILVLLVGVNAAFILKHADSYRMTFHGGDDQGSVYVVKGDSLTLSNSYKKDKVHDDYVTKYTFEGWEIDGNYYTTPNAKFTPSKNTSAKAVFTATDWATVRITLGDAYVTLTYDGNVEEVTSSKNIEIKVGTSVRVEASFVYTSTNFTVDSRSVSSPYTFTVQKNTSIHAGSSNPSCLAEGTKVTLADGSTKAVEDLQMGDLLLAFNHESGKYEAVPLLVNVHATKPAEDYNVINLRFSDGRRLRFVEEHGLFDKDLNRYVYLTDENAQSFVGHRFVSVVQNEGEFASETVTLTEAEITHEHIRVFNPATVWHINLVAEDMLTMSAGMVNLFSYDETMKYDEQAMKADLERYGEYTYEDFESYVSREVFEAFPFKYYKVSIEKGDFTFARLLGLIRMYQDDESLR